MARAASVSKSQSTENGTSKSDVTRQRILDAAAKVLAEKGYAHTRLSDIADEAESHAGGLYYYFASRKKLVEAILQIATRRTIEAINAQMNALPAKATTEDRIRAAVTGQIAEILSHDAYTTAFLKIYSQVPEDVKKRHRPVLREFFEVWREIIRKGQEAGEIRPDIDASVMRLSIIGSIQWSAEWVVSETSSAEALGEQMAKLFFSGIRRR
ncbi:MAG: TetR/AcrR family transcriptional regulator [Rhodospirillaceae bacterium]|nr:MAG: TetR/AcrR family transcriptional regulator [Rhodospirillaceae bacterium]